MTAPRRILVAGATGVIGRSLVPMLLAHGDEVVGLARSEASAERVRALGATAVRGDALDRERVHAAVAEVRPDVIVHQLTAIPRGAMNPRRMGEALAPTNRLRREATRHIVEAGETHGVRRIVAQSVAFAYRPEGPWVVDETAPLDTEAKGAWGEIVGAVVALEEAVTTASGITGVVLRFGGLYGPGTATAADGLAGRLARARRLPIVGGGEGRQSFLHPHDAATAILAALERGAGIYNVVDDHPAPANEWIPALAAALGAPPPRRVPAWLVRVLGGPDAVRAMTVQRGASNARARADLHWRLEHADWRQGFATTLGA